MYCCTQQDNEKKVTSSLLRKALSLLAQRQAAEAPTEGKRSPPSLAASQEELAVPLEGGGLGQQQELARKPRHEERTLPAPPPAGRGARSGAEGRDDPGDGSPRLRGALHLPAEGNLPAPRAVRGGGRHRSPRPGPAKPGAPDPSPPVTPPAPGVTYQLPGPAQAGGTPPAASSSSFSISSGGSK